MPRRPDHSAVSEFQSQISDADTPLVDIDIPTVRAPLTASLLSFVYPGMGHLLSTGVTLRSLVFVVLATLSYALTVVGVGIFTTPLLALYAAIDIYIRLTH